jgi:DHA1 family bicyclomycin/chloramphenicol resistance-like MFS transporter
MSLKPGTLSMTVVLALLTALGPMSTDMYLPSLPDMAHDLTTDPAGVQLTLSAFLFGFAVGQFAYGPVSDRLGRRKVLLFGLGLYILASAICALAPNIQALVAARFLQALGASGPIVLARAMVRDLYAREQAGRLLSQMAMIMGVVPAIAPVLGGVLHEAFGWRSTFVLALAVSAALGAVVLLGLPETLKTRLQEPLSFPAILRGFGLLLRHPTYRVYVSFSALAYGGLFAFISGSSFVLQQVYGLSEVAFAFSFAIMVIGFMSGTLLAQRVVVRHGVDRTIGWGVAALALGGLSMLALVVLDVPTSLAVTLPMALYAGGVGLTMPQSMAGAMGPFPERAGAASSLLGICQMSFAAILGIGLGQFLGGSALPLPIVVAAVGCLALLLFLATVRLRAA